MSNWSNNENQILHWLSDFLIIKESISYHKEEIDNIIEAGMGIDYSKDVISKTNKLCSTVENSVIQIDKEGLSNTIKRMENIIKAIDRSMKILNKIERIIIESSCIKHMTYVSYIDNINVTECTAIRIKKEAVKKMVNVIYGYN